MSFVTEVVVNQYIKSVYIKKFILIKIIMGSVSFENDTGAIKRNILVFKLVVSSDFGLENLEEHHKFKITIYT